MIFKGLRKLISLLKSPLYTPFAHLVLFLNGVVVGKGLRVRGFMKVLITRRGKVLIGKNFKVNSGNKFNVIGRQQKTTLWVEGSLTIGDSVGISSTAIICNHSITIGNHVTIGGNTVIYDTDFHSLDPKVRKSENDHVNAKKKPVIIMDNVFIGAHTTILKGVSIGENSIIGACSVITKNIPPNEIWAGNPARLIRKINA